MSIEGMGHDLPRAIWPRLIDAIARHARRADEQAERRPDEQSERHPHEQPERHLPQQAPPTSVAGPLG